MRRKTANQVDWDMVVLCLILAISLWVNTITRPEVTQIAETELPTNEAVVEVVAEVESVDEPTVFEEYVSEIIPNYAGSNSELVSIQEIEVSNPNVREIFCPNCNAQLTITELERQIEQLETELEEIKSEVAEPELIE